MIASAIKTVVSVSLLLLGAPLASAAAASSASASVHASSGTLTNIATCETGLLLLGTSRQELIIQSRLNNETYSFHIGTGCSVSQIDSDTAADLGLLSHPKLLGKSTMADGTSKYDYITVATMGLESFDHPMVLKVGPDQPFLFGLDALARFKMTLDITHTAYHVCGIEESSKKYAGMRMTKFENLLDKAALTMADLVPIASLPPPDVSYKRSVISGTPTYVFDLGFST